VILEEASFIPPELFQTIIVPLLGVGGTAVLGISTPQGEDNYYSELVDLVDIYDNKPIFKTIHVRQACQACIDNDIADKCKHLRDQLPSWKPIGNQDKVEAIMGAANKDTFIRENQGVIKGSSSCVFRKKTIEKFASRPFYEFTRKPSIIYIGIDPSGGGDQSHYAFVSMAVENNQYVVSFVCLFIFSRYNRVFCLQNRGYCCMPARLCRKCGTLQNSRHCSKALFLISCDTYS
jgi:hypothetical protein